MVVANIPRMCTFPEFLRSMYTFGDVNTSVFIGPVSESSSQTDLNRTINELESERLENKVKAKNRNIEKIQSNAHIDLKKKKKKNEEKFNLFYIDLK